MKFLRRNRRDTQRGATLTGYALVVATMTAGSLGALGSLEDSSGEFLTNSGQKIGAPQVGAGDLGNVVFTTPDGWTPPTQAPESTTSSTTSTTVVDTGSSTTAAPTTSSTTIPSTTTTTAAPTTTSTTEATTTTTTEAPVSYNSVPVEVAAGGCIQVDPENGWLSREDTCDGEFNEMTSTHLPNGNVILSTSNDRCFMPWDGNDTWVDSFDCNGEDNQEWWIIPVGDSFMYQNVDDGRCLDLTRGGNNTQWAVLRDCDTDDTGQLLNLG